MRRTNLTADGVAGLEIEFADLRRGDVDVVRTGEIVIVRGAKEAVAVGKDFQDAFGEDVSFFFALCLQDLEDKVLLTEAAGAWKIQLPRDLGELRDVLFFQFSDGHVHLRELLRKGGNERSLWDWIKFARKSLGSLDRVPRFTYVGGSADSARMK